MAGQTDTQVIIGGKVLTLSGSESVEYLQRIAAYVNQRISEFEALESYRFYSSDMRNLMLQINMADDVFKSNERIAELEQIIQDKDASIYALKHDFISAQMQLDDARAQIEKLKSNGKN